MREKKYCIICGKELKGKQRMYCSYSCAEKAYHKRPKNRKRVENYYFTKGLERKFKLIEQFGGGCQLCGYNKNISALEFHHINPESKEFSLQMLSLGYHKWESVQNEAKKCMLLCSNCHREIHCPDYTTEEIKKKLK